MDLRRAKALAKKAFGPKGWAEWKPGAPDAAAKEDLKRDLADARADLEHARAEFRANPEIGRDSIEPYRLRVSDISGNLCASRAAVGFTTGVGGVQFFHVKGQGDTFEEAFERAKRDAKGGA